MLIVYLAAAALLALAVTAIRYPLVRRIGLRNAIRRPREALLVMLGCLLGSALIVGNAAVGDSFTASMERQAVRDFGTLDASVTYESRDDWSAASARLAASPLRRIASATAVAVQVAPVTADTAPSLTSPRANLVDADYRRAGSLGAAPGAEPGSGPREGEAWASRRLADRLSLRVGTTLTVHTPTRLRLRVTRIVDNPLASFLDGAHKAGETVLVPPGTVLRQHDQHPTVIDPNWSTLVVSRAPDDVDTLRRDLTKVVTPFDGEVHMTRHDALRNAEAQGRSTAAFLTTIGAFGIIAGILLLINVLLMLAEERLAELGTMRAVGLSRLPLIGSFALEGGMYAAVGSVVGGVAGVGLGRVLVGLMNQYTSSSWVTNRGLALHFAVSRQTVLTGVATGFLVSVVAVIATAYRVSRMDVIRSLRSLPSPPRPHRLPTWCIVAGLVAGVTLSYLGYTAPTGLILLLGGIATAMCLGALANRRWGWEAGMLLSLIPLAAFCIAFAAINPESESSPTNTVLSGVASVTAGVVLLNALQARAARWVRAASRGRTAVPARLGLANPVAHRVRTLLTVGPFALVVFTLAFAEGLSHMISTELSQVAPTIGGSYTHYADSSAVRPFDFAASPAVEHAAPTGTTWALFTFDPAKPTKLWTITGFNRRMFDTVTPPHLIERASEYKTDQAAYAAVLGDADLVIVASDFLLPGGFGPGPSDPTRAPRVGDTYTMVSPSTDQSRDVTVAGVRHKDVFGQGPFYGEAGMRSLFGREFAMTDAMIVARDSDTVVERLQRTGLSQGVAIYQVEQTAHDAFATISGIINLFRSDLGIGVIVGVTGIAVVLVRSVRDRRQQIGVLRAIGFDSAEIGRSFLFEGAFVAAQGLFVGIGFGVATTMSVSQSSLVRTIIGFTPPLRPPPFTILVLLGLLLVASLLASVVPARQAGKIPPALALRLVD